MKTLYFVFAILQIVCCYSCPDGYDLIQNGQCRGFYGSMSITRSDALNTAISKCAGMSLQPVIIHTSEEQSYWVNQNRTASSAGIILGLKCDISTNKWIWSDGAALDFKPPSGNYNTALNNACKTGCVWFLQANSMWIVWCDGDLELFDIYCMVNMKQPVPSANGCDSFEDDAEDGACYQIGTTAVDYQEAQLICRSFGAELASIHNDKGNSFVRRLAVSKGATGGLYLGATLSGKGNEFGWIDGSPWDYGNFSPGFLISALGSCLGMDTQGTSGDWVNVDCSSKFAVACTRQHNYTLPTCSSGTWKEGQIIYTPGFPYDASVPCDFIIAVDAGKHVQLQLFLLEAKSCCDHLVLGDNYIGGTVIANLTGSISNGTYTTKSSNFMRVSWQPNGGVNVRGAMFAFRSVD